MRTLDVYLGEEPIGRITEATLVRKFNSRRRLVS